MNPQKKLIVYGGAFNPPTPAHISAIRQLSALDGQLVLLPSGADFVRKWKPGQQVLPDIARLELLSMALKNAGIRADVDCLAMEENLCTYDALARLREKYSAVEAWFVIGEDKLEELPRWAHARQLVRSTRFVLINYEKSGYGEIDIPGLEGRARIYYVKLPAGTENTHATDIRELMRAHSAAALETEAGRYMAAYPQCLRVSACAPRMRPAAPEENADAIIGCMNENDADILAFPESSISGYPCGDPSLADSFLDACERAAARVAGATRATGQLVFVGCPVRVGGVLYDCAVAAVNGEVRAIIPQSRHENCGGVYEKRRFASGAGAAAGTAIFAGREAPFGTDLLLRSARGGAVVGVVIGDDAGAATPSSIRHCMAGANVIVNLADSSGVATKAECRRGRLGSVSGRGACAYIYASWEEGMIYLNGKALIYEKRTVSGTGSAVVSADIDLSMSEAERLRVGGFEDGRPGYQCVGYDQVTFRFPSGSTAQTFLTDVGTEGRISPNVLNDFILYYYERYGFDREKLRVMAAEAFGVNHISETDKALRFFFSRH